MNEEKSFFEEMFAEIGKKIKTLAKVICWIGIIGSFITILIMFSIASDIAYGGEQLVITGLVILILGPLVSWIGSFFMYGFGELIDNSQTIKEKLNCNVVQSKESAKDSKTEIIDNRTLKAKEIYDGHIKKCEYCGKNVPSSIERCECGCIVFVENYDEKYDENQESYFKCDMCGGQCKKITYVKLNDEFGTRYRNLCDDCIKKYNAEPSERK